MKNIADLLMQLSELPTIQKSRNYESRYQQFFVKAGRVRDQLAEVATALPLAESILPAPEYVIVRRKIGSAARTAKKIAEKLKEDPDAIGEKTIEGIFVRLTESAESILRNCKKGWESQLAGKTRVWTEITRVVLKLGEADEAGGIKAQAGKLSNAIYSLELHASRLPETDADISSVQNELDEVTASVSGLELDTPFGKFLQATASPDGANLEMLQEEAVSKAIVKHKLQNVFRIYVPAILR